MRLIVLIGLFASISCNSNDSRDKTYLDLSNQKLLYVPDSVFNFTRLEYLELGNRNFTIYPPLSALGLGDDSNKDLNRITDIPTQIKALKNLKFLGLCHNNIQTLPSTLTHLKNLDTLNLSLNRNLKISEVYPILVQMKSLRYLNIFGTQADTSVVRNLRASLPNTKVITTISDMGVDIEKISKEIEDTLQSIVDSIK
jgi:Leucine-rich repeat (LRR) protein